MDLKERIEEAVKASDHESPRRAGARSHLSVDRGRDRCHVNRIDQIEPFSDDHRTCNDSYLKRRFWIYSSGRGGSKVLFRYHA